MTAAATAKTITKSSKSNLALAFVCLPRDRRADMTTFYAFCRIVDDIADSATIPAVEKQAQLDRWKTAVERPVEAEPELAAPVRELIRKYNIPIEYLHEIIAGVEMDIVPARYATFEDLRLYCYRVASAVGLASIEIFGYKNPACKNYAVDLGLALQLTNILRDVAQDFSNGGRIYLPLEDLDRFRYSPDDIAQRRCNAEFLALMDFEAGRAISIYDKAASQLPPEDRKSMAAAEIMSGVYRRLLTQMQRDRFRVFEKRYSITRSEKVAVIAKVMIGNVFGIAR